MCVKDQLD